MSKSATRNLVQHLDKHVDLSSSEEESDDEKEEISHSHNPSSVEITVPPIGQVRFVTRFASRNSPSTMSKDPEKFDAMRKIFSQNAEQTFITELINDSDLEENDASIPIIPETMTQPTVTDDLQEIHQKVLQHEEEQIKGVQLANAGRGNLKVVNNYSVTSKTCTIL